MFPFSCADVLNANEKLVLGMVWTLIAHYQINDVLHKMDLRHFSTNAFTLQQMSVNNSSDDANTIGQDNEDEDDDNFLFSMYQLGITSEEKEAKTPGDGKRRQNKIKNYTKRSSMPSSPLSSPRGNLCSVLSCLDTMCCTK